MAKHLLSPSTKTHRGRASMGAARFQVRSLLFRRQLPPDADSRPKGDGKRLLGWGCGWLLQSPPRGCCRRLPGRPSMLTGGMTRGPEKCFQDDKTTHNQSEGGTEKLPGAQLNEGALKRQRGGCSQAVGRHAGTQRDTVQTRKGAGGLTQEPRWVGN